MTRNGIETYIHYTCDIKIKRGGNKGKKCNEIYSSCKNPNHRKIRRKYISNKIIELSIIPEIIDEIINTACAEENSIVKRVNALEKKMGNLVININVNVHQNNFFMMVKNEDYIDKLEHYFNTREDVYNFIEQCAIKHITGDMNLFNKLYLDDDKPIFKVDESGNILIQDVADKNGYYTRDTFCTNTQTVYMEMITQRLFKSLTGVVKADELLDIFDAKKCIDKVSALGNREYKNKILKRIFSSIVNHKDNLLCDNDISPKMAIDEENNHYLKKNMDRLISLAE